ncbi:MAG: hypothetical protein RLZZ511_1934 [Cyanobacteriota bacterium]|jgi:hypothetical protein
MGVMSTVTRITAKPVRHGGHSLNHKEILSPCADALNPTTAVNWSTNNPTVVRTPRTSTVAKADQAERQAGLYEVAVENGIRVMKADAKRHAAHARLAKNHREYLGNVSDAQVEIATANKHLASKLHGHRETYAQLGYSLDRKAVTTEQRIELTAAKYGAMS